MQTVITKGATGTNATAAGVRASAAGNLVRHLVRMQLQQVIKVPL